MADLEIRNYRVRDDFDYQRGADPVPIKIVFFYLDAHGPFTEKFTLAEFADGRSVNDRIDRLRTQLRAIR